MKHPLTGLRVGAMLLFLIGFLSPVALTGAGAQDLTCDDFNSERAAQAVLDADPDMEETLDPDGDGVACNHEEDASDDAAADEEDDAAADEEDDAAADESDDSTGDSGSGDADAYLEDVATTASSWSDSLEELLEIDPLRADVTDDEVDSINEILTVFADAPSTAADFEAPEGLEDVQSAFEDLADGYAEYSDAVVAWSQTDPGSDEETEATAAAEEAVDEIDSLNDSLLTAIEDAGGSAGDGSDATDDGADDESDSTDGGSAEGDEYLADTQELVDEWADSYDTWVELDLLVNYPDFTDADWETLNEIIALWAVAPDDVSTFDAPEGYEDVQAALEDLADGYFEIQDLALQWNDTEAGSDEEAELEDGIVDAVDAIPDLQDAYDTAVEDAGGSSADGSDDGADATDDGADDESDATDDGADDGSDATDDGSDDGSGGDADTAAYLEDVTANNDEWMAGATRLTELLTQEEELTDDDIAEIGDIIDLWTSAPDTAAEAEVPEGMEDVQADYEEVADGFAATADAFNAWLATESGSPESDDAWTEFIDSMTEAITLSADLTTTVEDAG
jgi:hypothetical protein